MFFGTSKGSSPIDENKIKDVVASEIYSAILDFINIMTERKGANSKYQERVAREFYMGIQEVVKTTVQETIKNMLEQAQIQSQEMRQTQSNTKKKGRRVTKKLDLEPE